LAKDTNTNICSLTSSEDNVLPVIEGRFLNSGSLSPIFKMALYCPAKIGETVEYTKVTMAICIIVFMHNPIIFTGEILSVFGLS